MSFKVIVIGMGVAASLLVSAASQENQAMAKRARSDRARPGKPGAPVEIAAVFSASGATLTIKFNAAGEGVSVRAYGTDGLVVTGSETPVISGTFIAGETLKLPIVFTTGVDESNLAVVVSGEFNGSHRSRVVSFTVGDKKLNTLGRSGMAVDAEGRPLGTTVDSEGRALIVMPAESK
jgi:hypothetical protein